MDTSRQQQVIYSYMCSNGGGDDEQKHEILSSKLTHP
jgi:hypothetical protein